MSMLDVRVRVGGRADPVGRVEAAARPGSLATWLSCALAAVATAASLGTLLPHGLLRGLPAMNGSARGTALVVVTAAVPLLLGSVWAARRGSSLAQLFWLGSLGFLAYNALMFLFATPANQLFLLYVAWLGLSAWSIGTLVAHLDAAGIGSRFDPRAPHRGVAVYIWVVVALNALAWLSRILPAAASRGMPDYLRGTGLTTSIGYVQDLALWLPFTAVVAAWLWRRRPWGLVLSVAALLMWAIESVSIAVDQAYGAAADPASSVVSVSLTPAFAVVAVVSLVPLALLLKGFDHEGLLAKARRLAPDAPAGPARTVALASLSLLLTVSSAVGGFQLVRTGYGMPMAWLDGTPFTSWAMPGVALLVGVTVPQLAVLVLVVVRSSWARTVALAAGAALVLWIVVELLVLQRFSFLQPAIALVGLAEMALAGVGLRARPTDGAAR